MERPDIPPPRIATFFGDVPEDIDMDDDAILVAEEGRRKAAVKDEAGKRRDDRRVSLV